MGVDPTASWRAYKTCRIEINVSRQIVECDPQDQIVGEPVIRTNRSPKCLKIKTSFPAGGIFITNSEYAIAKKTQPAEKARGTGRCNTTHRCHGREIGNQGIRYGRRFGLQSETAEAEVCPYTAQGGKARANVAIGGFDRIGPLRGHFFWG